VAVILVIVILLIDQAIKVWVKTSMPLHGSIRVTSWFFISFIENNGMAYGMQIGSKLLLSLFRVAAIALLSYYIWQQARRKARWGYIVCLAMVVAGAFGNLIDCMFYGLCFDASTPGHVSSFVGFGNGYAPFLMGKVVDMFYFPLIVTHYPEWFPLWGGEEFIFFSPVFNFADASISVGVVALLLFFRKEVATIGVKEEKKEEDQKEEEGEKEKKTDTQQVSTAD